MGALNRASSDAIFDARRMAMRTTVTIDDQLLKDAEEFTGIKEKATLIRMGLEALVQREAARRLARMGGTQPGLEYIPRRRPQAAE
jgi:Arc/MetJ family transcription regulator